MVLFFLPKVTLINLYDIEVRANAIPNECDWLDVPAEVKLFTRHCMADCEFIKRRSEPSYQPWKSTPWQYPSSSHGIFILQASLHREPFPSDGVGKQLNSNIQSNFLHSLIPQLFINSSWNLFINHENMLY